MSNEKQAQELTGNAEEATVDGLIANWHKEYTDTHDLTNGYSTNDLLRMVAAKTIASAPSLKAENERLREANRVMLDALKAVDGWMSGYGTATQRDMKFKHVRPAISIGEGRQGAQE